MKERGIIFSGPMVRAILDGRKSQTRRVIKPQPPTFPLGCGGWYPHGPAEEGESRRLKHYASVEHFKRGMPADFCPYGVPGDRLWVRETWCAQWRGDQMAGDEFPIFGIRYKADDAWQERKCPPVEHSPWYGSWRPSIHMPRWASRITLEVTGVRVERVQDITEEGAVKEGCDGLDPNTYSEFSAVDGFRNLWDSINAKRGYGWDANPWVWVIEFRKLEPSTKKEP